MAGRKTGVAVVRSRQSHATPRNFALGSSEPLRALERYDLTPLEAQTAILLAQGHTNREISESTKISPAKIRLLLRTIFVKMGVSKRAEVGLKIVSALAPLHKKREQENSSFERVMDRATEVIGDRDEALRWLGTPVRALDYATPISLLGTSEGVMRVEDILGRMEHGVW